MIEIKYNSGTLRRFDVTVDPDRRTVIVSLMTVPEMVAFFKPGEAAAMAKTLGVSATGSETVICTNIYKHFHG